MMRERSTWQNNPTSRQASTNRRADIYEMNQDHPQPSITDYENGDPDSWAETPTKNKRVEEEYEGGHVKRDEIGMGEMRKDTYDHKDAKQWNDGGKYDNERLASTRRSQIAMDLARSMLRTDQSQLLTRTAAEMMSLPDQTLIGMHKRLVSLSPARLASEARMRRALACTKIAARILGSNATDQSGEKLARIIASLDDRTLKTMIAAIRTAEFEPEEDDDGKHEAGFPEDLKKDKEEDDKHEAGAPVAGRPISDEPETDNDQIEASGEDCDNPMDGKHESMGLTPNEMSMMEGMIAPPCAEPAPVADMVPSPVPVPGTMPGAVPVPGAPSSIAIPIAEVASDISFDDDEDNSSAASDAQLASLNDVFNDAPEIRAQREMQAAQAEQTQRASNFNRTASTGAKKLGQVTRTAGQADPLADLWD